MRNKKGGTEIGSALPFHLKFKEVYLPMTFLVRPSE